MSKLSRIMGMDPNIDDKELQERRSDQRKLQNAKRLLKHNRFKEAAEALIGSEASREETSHDEPRKAATSEKATASEKDTASEKAATPEKTTEKQPTSEEKVASATLLPEQSSATAQADDFISKFDEAAAAKIKEAGIQPVPVTEVQSPQANQSSPQPAIVATPVAQAEAESDNAIKARAHQPKPQSTKAPVEEEDNPMINADLSFYTYTIGNAAYRFDGGLDKEPSDELRAYVKSVIARDPAIIDEVVKEHLPVIIAKNPGMIPDVIKMIQDAENQHIPIKAFYINVKDPDVQEEYDTWEAAKASIAKEIATYGVDPTEVFRTIWRKVDEDGNPGDQLGEVEVVDFIENHYHGDKEELKKLLRVKYVDKPTKGKGKTGANGKANTSGKTSADKAAKPAKGKTTAEEADAGNGAA